MADGLFCVGCDTRALMDTKEPEALMHVPSTAPLMVAVLVVPSMVAVAAVLGSLYAGEIYIGYELSTDLCFQHWLPHSGIIQYPRRVLRARCTKTRGARLQANSDRGRSGDADIPDRAHGRTQLLSIASRVECSSDRRRSGDADIPARAPQNAAAKYCQPSQKLAVPSRARLFRWLTGR